VAGDGESLPELRRLAAQLDLEDFVEFPGFLDREQLRELLAAADIALAPEPSNPLNDVSTMIKIPEYLAMSCPVVSYDLPEARVSAGDAAVYARPNDEESFADCIEELLDDPERRRRMAAAGRMRVEQALSWERSEAELFKAYSYALAGPSTARPIIRSDKAATTG
jgi:glycosyltransferase involved in cell wall biosynthesis